MGPAEGGFRQYFLKVENNQVIARYYDSDMDIIYVALFLAGLRNIKSPRARLSLLFLFLFCTPQELLLYF